MTKKYKNLKYNKNNLNKNNKKTPKKWLMKLKKNRFKND